MRKSVSDLRTERVQEKGREKQAEGHEGPSKLCAVMSWPIECSVCGAFIVRHCCQLGTSCIDHDKSAEALIIAYADSTELTAVSDTASFPLGACQHPTAG